MWPGQGQWNRSGSNCSTACTALPCITVSRRRSVALYVVTWHLLLNWHCLLAICLHCCFTAVVIGKTFADQAATVWRYIIVCCVRLRSLSASLPGIHWLASRVCMAADLKSRQASSTLHHHFQSETTFHDCSDADQCACRMQMGQACHKNATGCSDSTAPAHDVRPESRMPANPLHDHKCYIQSPNGNHILPLADA